MASKLLFDAEIPLIRVRHLVSGRINEPVHLSERSRRCGENAARPETEGVANAGRAVPRLVQIICDQLTDIRPIAFIVLRQLNYGVPTVIETAIAASDRGFICKPVCQAKSSLPVTKIVVENGAVAVRRQLNMWRKNVAGQTGIPLRGTAARRPIGDQVSTVVEVIIANIEIRRSGFSVQRPQSDIPAETEVQGQPTGRFPLVLYVEAVNPSPMLVFEHAALIGLIGDPQDIGG